MSRDFSARGAKFRHFYLTREYSKNGEADSEGATGTKEKRTCLFEEIGGAGCCWWVWYSKIGRQGRDRRYIIWADNLVSTDEKMTSYLDFVEFTSWIRPFCPEILQYILFKNRAQRLIIYYSLGFTVNLCHKLISILCTYGLNYKLHFEQKYVKVFKKLTRTKNNIDVHLIFEVSALLAVSSQ